MKNPFIYGEAVIKENFCNRVEEINKLKLDLTNSQKVFLISARRMGKTSLIKNVLQQLREEGYITIFIDLENFTSYKDFLNGYLLELIKAFRTVDKILNFLQNVLPGFRVDVSIDETGQPTVSLGYSRTAPGLGKASLDIYSLPEVVARKRRKKVIVVFDEFQEITRLDGANIEGVLRSVIQHQRDVGYVFAGSRRHVLMDMVNSPKRPFYKIGPVMFLDKIPRKDFFHFIKRRFLATKIKIPDSVISEVMDLAEDIPYYVQMFCHELWDLGVSKGNIQHGDLKYIIDQLITQQAQNFHIEWSRLILTKRQLLKAIANSGGKNILSKEYLSKNDLPYPSSTRRTLISLINDGYIEEYNKEYFISDLLFREWIKRYCV